MVCTEFSYIYRTNSVANLKNLLYWERRISMTQKRYLKAIETLARIRKITGPGIQVNISTSGGQQVNVQS
jgi:hypothetical protein